MNYPRAQLRVLEGPTGTTGTAIDRVSSKRGPLMRPLVGGSRSSETALDEGEASGKISGEDAAGHGGLTMRTMLSRKRFHSWWTQL